MKKIFLASSLLILFFSLSAQQDSLSQYHPDSSLRIINLNPFFSLHVDSALSYQLQINKNPENYFWYLKNAPLGLKIGKDDGIISFKASKAFFLSGRLKYDVPYKVVAGVQNLNDPSDKIDTSFNIIFFNTDVIPSKVKPTVYGNIWISEGEPVNFRIMCETGNFPIDNIFMTSSLPIKNFSTVQKCGDEFSWTPDYDVAKESDPEKSKTILLSFIGSTKMGVRDTATVRIIVRDALNQPMAVEEYNQVVKSYDHYVLQLKYTFLQLDKSLRKTKNTGQLLILHLLPHL